MTTADTRESLRNVGTVVAQVHPDALAGLKDIFENRIPFNRSLGLKVISMELPSPEIQFSMRPDLIGNFSRGMLHGGVISSVLDVAGGLAAMLSVLHRHAEHNESVEAQLSRFARIGTIDQRVDYLRPGIGVQFRSCTQIMRSGSRVAVVRSDLYNELDEMIASAVAAYTVG